MMLKVTECGENDIPTLALLNKQLIEDEQADNTMSLPELEKRMTEFLSSEYKAFFFLSEEELVGYALCNMIQNPLYLRQFFICRDKRGRGYGRLAFNTLLNKLNISEIDIDVYTWNEVGAAFWKAMGFKERYTHLRLHKK